PGEVRGPERFRSAPDRSLLPDGGSASPGRRDSLAGPDRRLLENSNGARARRLQPQEHAGAPGENLPDRFRSNPLGRPVLRFRVSLEPPFLEGITSTACRGSLHRSRPRVLVEAAHWIRA